MVTAKGPMPDVSWHIPLLPLAPSNIATDPAAGGPAPGAPPEDEAQLAGSFQSPAEDATQYLDCPNNGKQAISHAIIDNGILLRNFNELSIYSSLWIGVARHYWIEVLEDIKLSSV